MIAIDRTNTLKPALTLLALTGLFTVPVSAQQVAAPAVATPVALVAEDDEPDIVLDEVIVRGKQLAQTIADAEDDFYKLYNQLNKNDDYDVNCAQVNIDPDNGRSRLTSRVCLPGFVANAMADWAVFKARCQPPLEGFDEFSCLDRNRDERLSWQEASARPELEAQLFTLDADNNGYISRDEYPQEGAAGPPAYMPPSPDLVLMEGTQKWYAHMMQVIRANPELQEKAGNLDGLWHEMRENQRLNSRLSADLEADRPPPKHRGRPPR